MPDTFSPIPELNQLKEFEERHGAFAEGFQLYLYGDESGMDTYSTDPEFASRLIQFAVANYTGSGYALWRVDDREDLATLPVIVLGDEGGEFPVARNLREFFQLLVADTEISVNSEAYFLRDDDHEPSPHHRCYVRWLSDTFGLDGVRRTNRLIAAARAGYGERFEAWMGRFIEDYSSGR